MKTMKLLALALTVGFFTGCNNDDDSNGETTLEGTWKLTRVQGGFGGADEEFQSGAITWTFDFDDQTVDVVNNQPESDYDFFETGTYDFEVLSTNDPNDPCGHMIIDNLDFGCLDISSNTLKLDQQMADGFLITLKR